MSDGVSEVEQRANELSGRISSSQETLGLGVGIVSQADESFQTITSAADGASAVQSEISDVIESSQAELQIICRFFDRIKDLYQDVQKHINNASNLGTTKSAMFEDMDNMISQIQPLVRDIENHSSLKS